MLSEIMVKLAQGVQLQPAEVEEMRLATRRLDELMDRTEYRNVTLKNPSIFDPNFRTTPLHAFHCSLSTDTPIANNTLTEVTFETSWGDTSVFDFFEADEKKIRIDRSQLNVSIDGIIKWEGNSTGYRTLNMHIYKPDGTSIATAEISVVAAVNTEPTTVSFAYTEDIRAIFPEVGYMTMEVKQNSGGDLDIINFVMSVKIA